MTNYFIPHGIAVLLGMYYINRLFVKTDLFDQINKLILSMIPNKYMLKIDIDKLCGFIKTDKKNMGNEICLIVLEDFGKSKFIFKNIDILRCELSELLL